MKWFVRNIGNKILKKVKKLKKEKIDIYLLIFATYKTRKKKRERV